MLFGRRQLPKRGIRLALKYIINFFFYLPPSGNGGNSAHVFNSAVGAGPRLQEDREEVALGWPQETNSDAQVCWGGTRRQA